MLQELEAPLSAQTEFVLVESVEASVSGLHLSADFVFVSLAG